MVARYDREPDMIENRIIGRQFTDGQPIALINISLRTTSRTDKTQPTQKSLVFLSIPERI